MSIDPHHSIHAVATMLKGMGELFSVVGFAAVHNATGRPFLTSDNPVIWFDPSLPFEEQRPYSISSERGDVILYKRIFSAHGLLLGDVPNEAWVDRMNAQVCRFAYEAVIAQGAGHETLITAHAGVSPVYKAEAAPMANGMMTIHKLVFGARVAKPRWEAR